jgi:hypothetical protein
MRIILILFLFFSGTLLAEAQERAETIEYFDAPKDVDLNNPFKPLLPKRKPVVQAQLSSEPGAVSGQPGQKPAASLQQPGAQASAVVPLPPMTVTGIVWNSDRPQAIINGDVLTQGDMVPNTAIKVVRIQKTKIEFLIDGRTESIKP